MPFTKRTSLAGKKQAPMPGPKSATYKKIIAARKRAMAGKFATPRGAKKRPKTPLFSTLKSRQMIVERIKREIWTSVQEINQAIINLALAGNYSAAKALFDFAGVYSLPSPEEAAPAVALPLPSPGQPPQPVIRPTPSTLSSAASAWNRRATNPNPTWPSPPPLPPCRMAILFNRAPGAHRFRRLELRSKLAWTSRG